MIELILWWSAVVLGGLWVVTAAGQTLYTVAYFLWGRTEPQSADRAADYSPSAAIILCVRGADDTLAQCLSALDTQQYPQYEIHIAVDHPGDPAADTIKDFASRATHQVVVHMMDTPTRPGGLKCDRLLAVLERLPQTAEVVALVDADVVPPHDWLRRLIAPLADASVGAVSGNRWYLPDSFALAESVRVMWNAAAIVQMEWYGIPWGGSLALRRRSVHELDLHQIWATTFCEDTVLAGLFRKAGQRVLHVPNVVAVQSGRINWRALANWHARQLLAVRLHHAAWPLVAVHALNGGLATVLTACAVAACLAGNMLITGWWLLMCYVSYSIVSAGLMQLVARRNHRAIENAIWNARVSNLANRRGFALRYLVWSLVVIPVTQVFHTFNLCRVQALRHIEWRQIRYTVQRTSVRREGYDRYRG